MVFGGLQSDSQGGTMVPNSRTFMIEMRSDHVAVQSSTFNGDFMNLWESKPMVDVIIKCRNGQRVSAHRAMLVLCIPYFRQVFHEFHEIAIDDSDSEASDDDEEADGEGEDDELAF